MTIKEQKRTMALKFSYKYAGGFLCENDLLGLQAQVSAAHDMLHNKTGLGNDFLGWIDLPTAYDKDEFARIKKAADKIISDTDVFIVIGIGGSYLGARAAIEFLKSNNYNALPKNTPDIYFAGNTISGSALDDLLKICEGKRVSVNIVSKSAQLPSLQLPSVFLESILRSATVKQRLQNVSTAPPIRQEEP